MITKHEVYQEISGNFLTDEIPDHDIWCTKMSEEAKIEWLEEHKWEPLETWTGQEIWETIRCGAQALIQFLERKGIEVI